MKILLLKSVGNVRELTTPNQLFALLFLGVTLIFMLPKEIVIFPRFHAVVIVF